MPIPISDLPGHRALHQRAVAALESCVEVQSIDFKESAPWEELQHKIIRTTLAMANLRDGGVIVIGVSERGDQWELPGISNEHLATYQVDDVIDAIHKFASPSVDVILVVVPWNARRFLCVSVSEFGATPIVCRRDDRQTLKSGREQFTFVLPVWLAQQRCGLRSRCMISWNWQPRNARAAF
ncbi:MAG: ATP-binding protein [Acidobacteria bacterium]|nr:ATP-binding protein [Acidobacteriota bacterium]MBV9475901.1 ATP-binding protein [Acidobacteriota bacterium]